MGNEGKMGEDGGRWEIRSGWKIGTGQRWEKLEKDGIKMGGETVSYHVTGPVDNSPKLAGKWGVGGHGRIMGEHGRKME